MNRMKLNNIPKLLLTLAMPVALCAGLVPLVAQAATTEPLMIAAAGTTSCYSCGVISRIKTVKHKKRHKNTHLGLVTGAVVGGVIGHNVGHGQSATAAGAVVGGYAGNEIEKNNRKTTTKYHYAVRVDMNNGGTQTVNLRSSQGLYVGQRVRVRNGNISPR